MSKVVEVAMKEVGVSEKPPNSNNTKYNAWFGLPNLPWCAMFVSWCYSQAGQPLPNIGFPLGFAGCQTAYSYFKKKGWITDKPVAGDIVLFDWNNDGRHDHTGLFVEWLRDGVFTSIEGNTSMNNDSNGGNVMVRTRQKSRAIFIHVP